VFLYSSYAAKVVMDSACSSNGLNREFVHKLFVVKPPVNEESYLLGYSAVYSIESLYVSKEYVATIFRVEE
jgi:hypothetical protein